MLTDTKKSQPIRSSLRELIRAGAYLIVCGLSLSAIYYLYVIGSSAQFPHALDILIGIILVSAVLYFFTKRTARITALVIIAALYFALFTANYIKSKVTFFPVTLTDIKAVGQSPLDFLIAFGVSSWIRDTTFYAAAFGASTLLVVFGAIFWRLHFYDWLRMALRGAVVAASFLVAYSIVVDAVKDYRVRADVPIWNGEGLVQLSNDTGIVAFLAFTNFIESNARVEFFTTRTANESEVSQGVAASLKKWINASALDDVLPNIVVVHAESTFDVNDVLKLTKPFSSPLFYTSYPQDPTVQFRSPAIANTVGGGSWVSEFEVINGVDTRLFGVLGRYTHYSLSGYTNKNFIHYLKSKGYRATVYANVTGDFFNYGAGYQNYGYDKFWGPYDMKISETSDSEIMRKALAAEPSSDSSPFLKHVLLTENHSPHPCLAEYEPDIADISLAGNPSPAQNCALRTYLTRLRSTEKAVQIAHNYLKDEEARTGRPYVLLIYGDHQPWQFVGRTSSEWTLGLSFDDFRKDDSRRHVPLVIFSSKSDPFACCSGEVVPLTISPTLMSAYTANTVNDIYLPENLYARDVCGPDWIGDLVGDSAYYDQKGGDPSRRCAQYDSILAAFQKRSVMEHHLLTPATQ